MGQRLELHGNWICRLSSLILLESLDLFIMIAKSKKKIIQASFSV